MQFACFYDQGRRGRMTLHKTFKQQIEEIWDSFKEKKPELPDHEPYCWPIKEPQRHKDCHRECRDE